MADSFDLWGASLCWGYEDAPAPVPPPHEGVAAEKSVDVFAVKGSARDSLQDGPGPANILSTQDIDDHEASFDCGAHLASHLQDSEGSSTLRSARRANSSQGPVCAASPVRVPVETAAPEAAGTSQEKLGIVDDTQIYVPTHATQQPSWVRPVIAGDDTQIYVLPPSSGTGADDDEGGIRTLAYTSHAVALEVPRSAAANADTLQYEASEPCASLSPPAHRTRACADTLEYVVPTPPRKPASSRAPPAETLLYGLPDEAAAELPVKAPQPVATPVRQRRRSDGAPPTASSTSEVRRAGGSKAPGLAGRRCMVAPSAGEESQWLVPVKRRRAAEPVSQEPRVRPMSVPTIISGSQRSARRQLTLAESLERTDRSSPRACLTIDTFG